MLIAIIIIIIIIVSFRTSLPISIFNIILLFFLSLRHLIWYHLLSQYSKKIRLFTFLFMYWCWTFYVHLFYRCINWFFRLWTLWFLTWFSWETFCTLKTKATEICLWCRCYVHALGFLFGVFFRKINLYFTIINNLLIN